MSDGTIKTKGFYTRKHPIVRINIERKGDSCWGEYDPANPGDVKPIEATNFEGTFRGLTSFGIVGSVGNESFSLILESGETDYSFGYLHGAKAKKSGLSRFHATLSSLTPGAIVEIFVAPLTLKNNQKSVRVGLIVDGKAIEWDSDQS